MGFQGSNHKSERLRPYNGLGFCSKLSTLFAMPPARLTLALYAEDDYWDPETPIGPEASIQEGRNFQSCDGSLDNLP